MRTSLAAVLRRVALAVFPVVMAGAAYGATFTVTSTADSGAGSLRTALNSVNASCPTGPHTIAFNIPGSGPFTIAPASILPVVTCANTVIDGYTQPGADIRGAHGRHDEPGADSHGHQQRPGDAHDLLDRAPSTLRSRRSPSACARAR